MKSVNSNFNYNLFLKVSPHRLPMQNESQRETQILAAIQSEILSNSSFNSTRNYKWNPLHSLRPSRLPKQNFTL